MERIKSRIVTGKLELSNGWMKWVSGYKQAVRDILRTAETIWPRIILLETLILDKVDKIHLTNLKSYFKL